MPLTADALKNRLNARLPPTGILLGLEILELDQEAGSVVVRFRATEQFCNPMGFVQGGFIAAMLDDAAALAGIAKARAPMTFPTLEFKVSFLSPAKAGILIARARCLKLGKRVAFLEASLYDEKDQPLAHLSATALPSLLPDQPLLMERA